MAYPKGADVVRACTAHANYHVHWWHHLSRREDGIEPKRLLHSYQDVQESLSDAQVQCAHRASEVGEAIGSEKVLDRGEISVQLAAHSCDPGFYRELEGYGILDKDGTIPVVVAAADESMILTMNRLERLGEPGALLVTAYSGHIHVVSLDRVPSGVSGPRAQALKAGATVQQWCDSLRQGGAQAFSIPGVESVPGAWKRQYPGSTL